MNMEKKTYKAPQLTVHGTVGELTLKGGGGFYDAPVGVGVAVGPTNTGSH